jgi:hypothetical protein
VRTPLALLPLAVASAFAAAGCFLQPSDATPVGEDDADLRRTQLVFEAKDGATSARLGRGAARACDPVFEGAEGRRWSCRDGASLLEVIVRSAGDAIALDWPGGRSDGRRTTYGCRLLDGDASSPRTLSCRPLTPATTRASVHFAASAAGFRLANVHWVGDGALWLRGRAPRTEADFNELRAAGVQRLLVLGAEPGDEGARLGLGSAEIRSVALGEGSFRETCRAAVRALRELDRARADLACLYFQGSDDATGALATLALVARANADAAPTFQREACENGFGAGDPDRSPAELAAVEATLAPAVRKVAWLLTTGAMRALDDRACDVDPEPAMGEHPAFAPARFTCGTSTRWRP